MEARTQSVSTPTISTIKLSLKTQREGCFPKYADHPSLNVLLSVTKRSFTLLNWLQWRWLTFPQRATFQIIADYLSSPTD
ncbi:hypothetical protein T02_2650 [Trichinella nativa]|uniref:Uncharacterized protein n=1 Tax=Trichinella nativa TaxID=6335 RepID=A0A0V1L366_9BILA|nr:hypothetical protein T02_2650 [Trichinella nativa]